MATFIVRTAIVRTILPVQGSKTAACGYIQNRSIMGKSMREALPPPPPKPKPFDYVNKDYTWIRSLFDRTTHRFDENTKVVVVEGPIAIGKTRFAECLAEDLGMKHFPEANMDYHYILPNGVDLRKYNDQLPEDARCFDHVDFNRNPYDRLVANYQIQTYMARYGQYIDALAHLFNTGQGVVLERSPYSDFVFLEAAHKCNYISKGARSVYYDLRYHTIEELMRPHLVIYLDASVTQVQKMIKDRNYDDEVKGKALTKEFLCEMDHQYKNIYLKDIATHAELLVYDWSGGGEHEVVVEDIERIDFDVYRVRDDPKLKDWRLPREMEYADVRQKYTNSKYFLMNQFNLPRLDVPELLTSAEDGGALYKFVNEHPDMEYAYGYNHMDKGLLFKNKLPKYTVEI